MIEYRIRWSASSNDTFEGATEWMAWHDADAAGYEVVDALSTGGDAPEGLLMAVGASGFEWRVELRDRL